MGNCEDVFTIVDQILDHVNDSGENYDQNALNFLDSVFNFLFETGPIDPYNSNYMMMVIKIMATWPHYEIHCRIAQLDPQVMRNIFKFVDTWKDYPDMWFVEGEDRWFKDRKDLIMKYHKELTSVLKLIS